MKKVITQWVMGEARRQRASLNTGQAIIIVALAAVALIAIMGVAIDGGRLVLLRREEQNATDAAVLAATLSLCSGGTATQVEEAGLSAAAINGFSHGVGNTSVFVRTPPLNAPANTCLSCAVEVEITRNINPYFISLVYSGPLGATTRAVGSCHPDSVPVMEDTDGDGIPDAPKPPIAAFWGGAPPGACNQPGVDLAGSNIVIKGNLHSNSDLKVNPSNTGAFDCDNPPNPLDGGWTFGNLTYSGSAGGFQDAKIASCLWDDAPGVTPEPPVCGSECLTSGTPNPSDPDKVEPEPVAPYLNADGSINWPVDYKIQDFRPGGSIAAAAAAEGKYYSFASGRTPSCNGAAADLTYDKIPASFKEANGDLKPGIYYSDCNVKMSHSMSGGIQVTFVAEGTITVNGTMDANAYYDRLLFFANGPAPNTDSVAPQGGPSCTANGVHVSSSDSGFTGIIFAPNGNAQFSAASNISHDGCVIAYVAKNSSSGLEITCEPDDSTVQGAMSVTE